MAEFAGGAAGPVAVIWLIGAYFSQREELRETRGELARQAAAQEGALKASLAQQVLLRLPVAREILFQRFWKLLRSPDQTQHMYDARDLDYAVKHVRLSDARQMYGTPADLIDEYETRGIIDALEFALSEVRGLSQSADIADSTDALRKLAEHSLALRQLEVQWSRIEGWRKQAGA